MYWKPVWHVLEGPFELVLANAAHVKNVPGRTSSRPSSVSTTCEKLVHGIGLSRPSELSTTPSAPTVHSISRP